MSGVRSEEYFNTPIGEISYNIINTLKDSLNECGGWKVLAETFTIFSNSEIEQFKRDASPADRLLCELSTRLCTVRILANMLRLSKLYMPLYVICGPEPLVITRQPWQNSQSGSSTDSERERIKIVPYGSTLMLECRAEGLPPPVYSWFRGNEELTDQTGEILEIEDFGHQHVGEYCCRISQTFLLDGTFLEITSDPIEVDFLHELPVIRKQPENVTCREGSSVTLSFSIAESPAVGDMQFQWYRCNESLPGCTQMKLEISHVSDSNEGNYRCYITCKAGELWTDCASVTAYRPPDVAKEKFALLIGNDEYEHLNDLNTPSADVATLSKIFKELKFKVVALKNLTLKEMRNALKHFCEMLPADSYALFYFGGHGFSLHDKYMLPTDAPSIYLHSHCMCVSEVIKELYQTPLGLVVTILDMCLKVPNVKENPYIYQEVPSVYEYIPLRNLVQGFATTSNLGAYERSSETNGIYVKHLARALSSSSDPHIISVLEKVNEAVKMEQPDAAEKQIPCIIHNCSDFCLSGDVLGDDKAAAKYYKLTYLPTDNGRMIDLVFSKINVKAKVLLKLHKDTFLNSLDVFIIGATAWNVEFQVQNYQLRLDCHRINEGWLATIHNLQKLKGELSLSVILKDEQGMKTVDHSLLELRNVQLVCAWQLWHAEDGEAASIGTCNSECIS